MEDRTISTPLEQLFADTLGINVDRVRDDLAFCEIKEWDSVAHMAFVAAVEERYDLMLEGDDVIDMTTVAKIKATLARYGVVDEA